VAYAVVGVNNASGVNRQAANFAIPISLVGDFINASFERKSAEENRRALDGKVLKFVEDLSAEKSVYARISRYLSNELVAVNAELAITEVENTASRNVQNDIFDQYIFTAIDYSVGWLIETRFRELNGGGALSPKIENTSANVDGTWTVSLVFAEGKEVNTIWINEYGMWHLKSAGSLAAAKTTAGQRKQEEKDALRTDYGLALSAGYGYYGLFDGNPRGSAFDALVQTGPTYTLMHYGLHLAVGKDFGLVEILAGYSAAIRLGTKVAVMPYGNLGMGVYWHEPLYTTSLGVREKDLFSDISFPLSLSAGINVTTSFVPGLFLKVGYQFTFDLSGLIILREPPLPSLMHGVVVGAGYLF
jgi:hypothetical protein